MKLTPVLDGRILNEDEGEDGNWDAGVDDWDA